MREWTTQEIAWVRRNAGRVSIEFMADYLGRTVKSVESMGMRHGISLASRKPQRFWTDEEIKFIKRYWGTYEGAGVDIADHLDRTYNSVVHKARELKASGDLRR